MEEVANVVHPTSTLPSDGLAVVDRLCCGGYVFYVSDGARVPKLDVESVKTDPLSVVAASTASSSCSVKRKFQETEDDDPPFYSKDTMDEYFHVCEAYKSPTASFVLCNRCEPSWSLLSDAQKDVLTRIEKRVDADRAERRDFTCAFVEGPGGCGKTRLMSHVMNHRPSNSLVLYVTKQNKRVQDFIHDDCLSGEHDPTVPSPRDLSASTRQEILSVVRNGVGAYALTAEKLLYALRRSRPPRFDTGVTTSILDIDYDVFKPRCEDGRPFVTDRRFVTVLVDEFSMLQPPLVHDLSYQVKRESASPLVFVFGGDGDQCGAVGWEKANRNVDNEELFTEDLRREIATKMCYEPLDIRMDRLQRCHGDPALAACVRRLRRVCESTNNARCVKKITNLVLARYSVEAGVDLFRQESPGDHAGGSSIQKIVPDNSDVLDFDGSGFSPDKKEACEGENTGGEEVDEDDRLRSVVAAEEYDERGATFEPSPVPPSVPAYDLLPLVLHFTKLYAGLAEIGFGRGTREPRNRLVFESVIAIRDRFPAFIVLTNDVCNTIAESFLLALYTHVRDRVSASPVPVAGRWRQEAWSSRLEYTLRRCVRRLNIDEKDPIKRQTLMVGMVYKMTSTIKSNTGACCLCNGETVVLTSIEFDEDDSPELMNAVTVRKLNRDTEMDFRLNAGCNKNRMSDDKRAGIMPFVPRVTENIYQMQGNTMPAGASCFVDLVNAPCRSAYVGLSRFQNSASIRGIVVSE